MHTLFTAIILALNALCVHTHAIRSVAAVSPNANVTVQYPSFIGIGLSPSMPHAGSITNPSSAANGTSGSANGAVTKGPGMNSTMHQNVSSIRPGSDSSDPYPATLLLCQETDCGDCYGFDLSTAPPNECLQPSMAGFSFVSAAVSQPSDSGMPYAVAVGPGGCQNFATMPYVNTCYNTPSAYTQFAIIGSD